jgi:hypothetical protein
MSKSASTNTPKRKIKYVTVTTPSTKRYNNSKQVIKTTKSQIHDDQNINMLMDTDEDQNMKNVYTDKKLDDDKYVRPNIVPADLLTPEDIKKRLKNYEQITGSMISDIVIGTRIQYFEVIDEEDNIRYRYKSGGFLMVNKYPVYIVLSSGRKTWSVQLVNNILFKEIEIDKIKQYYEKLLYDKNKIIEDIQCKIKTLTKKN